VVDLDKLADIYRGVNSDESPTFTWNNLGDQVLIVTVDRDSSIVSMLNDDTWYYLQISEDDDDVEVRIEGEMTFVPKGVVLPRYLGLEVLQKAEEFSNVLISYSWRLQ
jgi:hypothetical protein